MIRTSLVVVLAGLAACGSVEVCGDGIDNDKNGLIDCLDATCATAPYCNTNAAVEDCNDGVDNDGDGKIDCDDPDCDSDLACTPLVDPEDCSDGVDNDGDGKVDCQDSDCSSDSACVVPPENCTNGRDDDGDGNVDCLDSDCASSSACIVPEDCTDSAQVDEDGDGKANCADSDCATNPACDEIVGIVEIGHASITSSAWTGTSDIGWQSYPRGATSLRSPTSEYCGLTATTQGVAPATACADCDFAFEVTYSNATAQSGPNCTTFSLGTYNPNNLSYGFGYNSGYTYNNTVIPVMMYFNTSTSAWVPLSADVAFRADTFDYALKRGTNMYYY